MIRYFRRFKTTAVPSKGPKTVLGILQEANLVGTKQNPKDAPLLTEVEIVYSDLQKVKNGDAFRNRLSNQLKLYNNTKNFKGLYYLLTKVKFMETNEFQITIEIYNQIFRSLVLMRGKGSSNSLAQFGLNLVRECFENGLELDETSFHYLDKIVASSDLLQIQLQYQAILMKYNYFSLSYLISSGQYERCIDLFNTIWALSDKSDKYLIDCKIYNLTLASLERAHYSQVLEFLKLIKSSDSLSIRDNLWARIISSATADGHYALSLYCYNEYVKSNLSTTSETLLLKLCDVFAAEGDSERVIEILELVKSKFASNITASHAATIVESYCQSQGYKYAWEILGKFEDVTLEDKFEFGTLVNHYPVLRSEDAIYGIVDDLVKLSLPQVAEDIVFHSIFKKTHNDTNLTGMCILMKTLLEHDKIDQLRKNFSTVIHSISRSNGAKSFTLKFYQLLIANDIKPTTKEFYWLFKNSLFSGGADKYQLTKFLVSEHLGTYQTLTPIELSLLQRIESDREIQTFLEIFLSQRLGDLHGASSPPSVDYDVSSILSPPTRSHAKIGNYIPYYDMRNCEVLDQIRQALPNLVD